MKGKMFGFDEKSNEGAIEGIDGNRYSFQIEEWKGNGTPAAESSVDFVIDNEKAIKIYPIRDHEAETNKIVLGIISLLITFFLGFIGTLISRLAISKIPFSRTIIPALSHLVITALAFILVIGWIMYVVGTIYFMVKKFKLVNVEAV